MHYTPSASSFRPPTSPASRRTSVLAEVIEWGRMRDAFGLRPFLLTNCAVYNDGISPTICITNADAHRYARVDLGQFELHTLPDFLVYVADDERKPTADDFAQTAVVPRSPNAQQTAVIEECVVSPRLMKPYIEISAGHQ